MHSTCHNFVGKQRRVYISQNHEKTSFLFWYRSGILILNAWFIVHRGVGGQSSPELFYAKLEKTILHGTGCDQWWVVAIMRQQRAKHKLPTQKWKRSIIVSGCVSIKS